MAPAIPGILSAKLPDFPLIAEESPIEQKREKTQCFVCLFKNDVEPQKEQCFRRKFPQEGNPTPLKMVSPIHSFIVPTAKGQNVSC
mmetsp:Transcript_45750/g.93612  ORF Transcript_45750/g.93612 Transcript_45750/m.93612 type:complete len:86 (+) Transcript_45750:912-1169(+)